MNPGIPHPPFIELMRRFHGQIEQALYAAEQACGKNGGIWNCPPGCPFEEDSSLFSTKTKRCIMPRLRELLGDPVTQHDPETEAAALAAAEQYQREIVPCPSCGGPTFTANVDDQDTRLCMSDACRWKGPAMPEGGTDVMR